jgi:glycosyltransferase involved in cell wall biosynthesis
MNDEPRRRISRGEIALSLIVPVLNESASIEPFLEKIGEIRRLLAERHPELARWEIIFVDDGSTDDTFDMLLEKRKADPEIKILSLSRNFGKDTALTAGLAVAGGRAVIPIDVDLQDPPEAISVMVEKWLAGYDMVFGVRSDRGSDSMMKRLTARWFYRVYNAISDTPIPADAGDFRLLDARVVEELRLLPEHSRFMKGLYSWVGFRQAAVEIVRMPRKEGTSRWRYGKLWRFALGGLVTFSTVPLRVWTYIGALVSLLGLTYALFLAIRVVVQGVDVPGYASLMVVVLFMGGINLLTLGIIGEYVAQIHTETKRRPLYVIRRRVGFEASARENPAAGDGTDRI